jgi:hypothetical protein
MSFSYLSTISDPPFKLIYKPCKVLSVEDYPIIGAISACLNADSTYILSLTLIIFPLFDVI